MGWQDRTWRDVDGVRVEGARRPIFIRNGDRYFLTDLVVYADGAIACQELTDMDGLLDAVTSGRVATQIPQDAKVHLHHFGSWRMDQPHLWLTPDMLLGEVADELDRLNGRPDSTQRCLDAVDAYLDARDPARLRAIRQAYLAIPTHLREYALGDMDNRDVPLRILATPIGQCDPHDAVVRQDDHDAALDYFTSMREQRATLRAVEEADGTPLQPAIRIGGYMFDSGVRDRLNIHFLQIDSPIPVRIEQATYRSVEHAYWALSVSDAGDRQRIAAAERAGKARRIAASAVRRPGWSQARVGVMADLLRRRGQQHPELARLLRGTGDTRIVYIGYIGAYWTMRGTNWIGRLLEVVRSELAAAELHD